MARIFDREFTRSDLLQRVGDISQIAGVRQVTLEDGSEKGVQMIEARTGTGFRFNVLPSRGWTYPLPSTKGSPSRGDPARKISQETKGSLIR